MYSPSGWDFSSSRFCGEENEYRRNIVNNPTHQNIETQVGCDVHNRSESSHFLRMVIDKLAAFENVVQVPAEGFAV